MGLRRERHRGVSRPEAVAGTTPSALLLVVVVVLVLVWVALLAGWTLWESRRSGWLQAEQSSNNIVSVVEDDIEHAIALYDLSLRGLVDDLSLPGLIGIQSELRNQLLFDHAAKARNLGEMKVLDASGRVTMASQHASPPQQSYADFEFFRRHRADPDLGLQIGVPIADASTGGWSIPISRRLDRPGGSFAGVVFGTLRLDYFKELFARIDTGRGGSVAVYRTDGRLIYRTPFDPALLGRDYAQSDLFRQLRAMKTGVFVASSKIDGIKRFYAHERIADLPLVLLVGVDKQELLAQWTKKAVAVGAGTLALSIAVGVLVWAFVRELHRRARAERTALENERRYRMLAEQSFDMIVRFDSLTQQRTYVSPACRRLYGYEPEEAMAMSTRDIIHPDDFAGVCAALERLEHCDNHTPILYRGRRKDGSYIWVEASLTRSQDPKTGATEIVSVVRDASERIGYEAALRQAKEEADAANSSKSRFLATMSHELRTPLNAIMGFTEIMQSEVLGPLGNDKYRSYITDIHLSSSHLLQLINDILDLAKAEAGKLELNEEVIDLGEVIAAVVRVSRAPIEKARLTVAIDLAPDLPLLRADERKTRQILFNLIGNAVKFTPAGGRIAVAGRRTSAGGVAVTVTDTGVGMAPEDLQRALEPFVQIDNPMSANHKGTGLGLPTVKALVEAHGGRLELSSAPGVGTESTATFPPERVVADTARTVVQPAA
jgi:PAS domain S-box-containing protein